MFSILFWCTPFGYLYYLSFQSMSEQGLGAGIDPGMDLTPFPSSVGWYKIWAHDLSIVNLVRYPLDQAFAPSKHHLKRLAHAQYPTTFPS